MEDYWKLTLTKYKDSTGNWQTTISGGYLNIAGKTTPMKRYKDPDYYTDANGKQLGKVNEGYWKVTAELTGLINPFTNPITNAEVKETKIEVAFEDGYGWDTMVDYNSYGKYLAMGAAGRIEKRYKDLFGVEIKLAATFVKGEEEKPKENSAAAGTSGTSGGAKTVSETPTTAGTSGTSGTSGISGTASTPSLDGEFTFNVEQEDKFIGVNNQFGTLTLIGAGEIKEEPTEMPEEDMPENIPDDELDEEYLEDGFTATEEAAFILQKSEFVVINSDSTNDIKGYDPEKPDEALSTNSDAKYPISKDTDANIKKIIEVAKKSGITNKYSIAAMLAICKKESGFIPQNEGSYAKTSAARIKQVFSKFKKYSDAEVDRIKKNPKEFFDIIYGGRYGNAADEGYKYRGRGLNQITFKGNYEKYKGLSGYDIVKDPDLLNTIEVAAKCLAEYFKANFKNASKDIKSTYKFTDINSFKSLDDAVGAFYHANAGFGTSYNAIVADPTGGRKKAFAYAGPLSNTYGSAIA